MPIGDLVDLARTLMAPGVTKVSLVDGERSVTVEGAPVVAPAEKRANAGDIEAALKAAALEQARERDLVMFGEAGKPEEYQQ